MWASLLIVALFTGPALGSDAKSIMEAPSRNAVTGKLPSVPPTPPHEAAKTFRVLDGFRMDLLAAEPLVASPVAMTYDENGRAYVCEMRDYPYTDKARHKPGQENPTDQPIGRIRMLEDSDGDGTFDKSTIYADGLSWPTGVACFQGGIFVAATPDIWYFKDTTGDGVADERRKVLTGFRKLNVQAVMNNLTWGLDNRIHGAGGSNGGQIRPVDQPEAKPVAISRHDFSIDPASGALELLSGGARFGGSFDDWGNRFLCNIRNPAQHVILPGQYLSRNPHYIPRSPIHDMAEAGDQLPVFSISPPEPWRVIRARRWAGERDIAMPRSELVGAGVVTSSSGITSYRGEAYLEKYRGNVFVCECAGNLFYRLQLTPEGVTFRATRADSKVEMVASTDNWFRPVNFVNAPDGTLHVMDMYRENIEHPWSIPDDIHAAVDLEAGRDRGRIWRLTPPHFTPGKPPRLGQASINELVATLENPNSWWRETAQRLLFERQDPSAVPPLQNLVKNSRVPAARLHALWTLHGLKALTLEELQSGLRDPSPGIREHSIRLWESFSRRNHPGLASDAGQTDPGVLDRLLVLAQDPDARVRMQTAFTLGEVADSRAIDGLASIALHDANDPWVRTAVLTSVARSSDLLLRKLLADPMFASEKGSAEMLRELSQIVGVRGQRDEIARVLAVLSERDPGGSELMEVVSGVGEGLKRSGKSLRRAGLMDSAAELVNGVLTRAAHAAADSELPVDRRVANIRLLAYDDFGQVRELLANLLESSHPQEVQRAAVQAIGRFTEPEAVPILLANWQTQTPAVRDDVMATLLGVRTRALPLLKAVESGLIPANQIPFAQRRTLTLSPLPEVKELATRLFSGSAPGPRKEVIERYKPALQLAGDPRRGQEIFEKSCIACHRAGSMGTRDVGPNLATIRAWNPEQVLINILDPNREVTPNYVGYTVQTVEGRIIYGLIIEDTPASLTLKRPDSVTESVFRRDIDQISGSGTSLMPDGLESVLSLQNMSDLIAFLLQPVSAEKSP